MHVEQSAVKTCNKPVSLIHNHLSVKPSAKLLLNAKNWLHKKVDKTVQTKIDRSILHKMDRNLLNVEKFRQMINFEGCLVQFNRHLKFSLNSDVILLKVYMYTHLHEAVTHRR